jgi:pimeloyl-ACP methyl ester carboxylesterase
MHQLVSPLAVVLCLSVCVSAAGQEHVTLTAPDGVKLKATYYPAGKPGPGLLLLHQCNQDRRSWAGFASAAAARGYHVLAMDYRGFGESEGQPFANVPEQQGIITEKWPGDVDAAFAYLVSRDGVDRQRIAAAGASCGVNQAALLASRHPEVKALMLLSGGIRPPAREYVRRTPGLSLFGSASHGDGDAVNTMRWILGLSSNPANKFMEYKAAGHGTEMFAVEKGLEPAMLAWLDAHLRNAPATLAAAQSSAPTPVSEFWDVVARPDGRARARAIYDDARRRTPPLVLFPEGELNAYAYDVLRGGNAEHAIWLFELNVEAYPRSANTYDSLSDAYLAAGKRDEALKYAEKALETLGSDTQINDDLRRLIRESAEGKVKQLRGKQGLAGVPPRPGKPAGC